MTEGSIMLRLAIEEEVEEESGGACLVIKPQGEIIEALKDML